MMSEPRYKANWEILSRLCPDLCSKIAAGAIPEGSLSIEFHESKSGAATACVTGCGRPRFLHSRYDPVNEARRWAAGLPACQDSVVLFLGWGLGYHALEWMRLHGGEMQAVVIAEPELALFLHSLQCADLRPLAQAARVEIVLGESGGALYQALLRQMEFILTGGFYVISAPFADIYPPEFLHTLRGEMQRLMYAKEVMLRHMAEMGGLCQRNIIRNLPAAARSWLPRDVKNLARKQPAVIIAAGPSLDRNIALLPSAQGKAWLFAVDTSLSILQQRGVSCQIVVTKDPTERNLLHFQGVDLSHPPVLAFDPQIDPAIPAMFPGAFLMMPNRNHALHSHIKGLELTPDDLLPLSTNVALAAFNLAVCMGCEPIIFVGLDLCFAVGEGSSHASGSALVSETNYSPQDGSLFYRRGEACDAVEAIEVEGIDGALYPTTSTFYEALRLLESLIAQSGVHCVDASEGGAKIAGMEIMTLAQALDRYCIQPIDDSVLYALPRPQRDAAAIRRCLSAIADHIEHCGETARQALECLHKNDLSSIPSFRIEIEKDYRLYQELQSALERIMVEAAHPGFWRWESLAEQEAIARCRWYFTEIEMAGKVYAPMVREAMKIVMNEE
ncbi:MAG: 6-hydroxymethylpterin diphosphokinase MptE-like protein [Candidatus Omnitrophota bacterium]